MCLFTADCSYGRRQQHFLVPLPVSEKGELDRSWTFAPFPPHGQMSRGRRQKTRAKKELAVSLILKLAGPGLQNPWQTVLIPDLDNQKNYIK